MNMFVFAANQVAANCPAQQIRYVISYSPPSYFLPHIRLPRYANQHIRPEKGNCNVCRNVCNIQHGLIPKSRSLTSRIQTHITCGMGVSNVCSCAADGDVRRENLPQWAWNNSRADKSILIKCDIGEFYEKLYEHFNFGLTTT